MASWANLPKHLWNMARGALAWVRLGSRLARLDERADGSALVAAQRYLEDRQAWAAVMNTLQFNDSGCHVIQEGLSRRHGAKASRLDQATPDARLLRKLEPMVVYFYARKEEWPEGSLAHGCAVGMLFTLLQAAHKGASQEDVLSALRAEMDAQMTDACTWPGPEGSDLVFS